MSIIGLVLSLLAGLAYYAYYAYSANVQSQNKKRQICKDAIEAQGDNYFEGLLPAGCSDPKKQAEANKKNFNKIKLDNCISQANTYCNNYLETNAYKTSTDNNGKKIYYLYQNQWDYVNNKLKSDKDECYRLYPSN